MRPPVRPVAAPAATVVVVAVSGAVAFGAAWPIRDGPAGTTGLVALLAFGISLMVGVSASEPVMRRAAADPAGAAPGSGPDAGRCAESPPPWVSGPAPAPAATPALAPARTPTAERSPVPAPDGERRGADRCFGCLRLEEVAGSGLLTVADSTVPLHLCRWCLDHVEGWHAREAARLRTEREPASRG
ncbi:hypothetical protein [Streptomyces sp. CB03911]|uniref:hypothetical protein n=1 Tax=Streptomyces sp. CB03911 TaxID=1804758 RepID=UPI00093E0A51|nr:hypothetical protein [Streptomyces sp. CB03911]OKI12053.1 hypothetical protein A6A07_19215 [Streptomyces sp. CB03911]